MTSGASFSKSTVSALSVGLDAPVRAFSERRLEGEYLFVLVDALFIKSREADRVVMRAALVVTGVCSEGFREILGIRIGDTESFASWDETFRWLKKRGLKDVAYVISDQHGGLTEGYRQALPRRDLDMNAFTQWAAERAITGGWQ